MFRISKRSIKRKDCHIIGIDLASLYSDSDSVNMIAMCLDEHLYTRRCRDCEHTPHCRLSARMQMRFRILN